MSIQCFLVVKVSISKWSHEKEAWSRGFVGVRQVYMPTYLNLCSLEYFLPHSSQVCISSDESSSSLEELGFPGLERWLVVMGPAGVFNGALLFSREYGTWESFCIGIVPTSSAISASK